MSRLIRDGPVTETVGRRACVSASVWVYRPHPCHLHRHYHATNMKLVVLGREPLATLEKMVRDCVLTGCLQSILTSAHTHTQPYMYTNNPSTFSNPKLTSQDPQKNQTQYHFPLSDHHRPHSSQVRSSFVNVSSLAHDFSSPLQPNQPGYKHMRAYAHIRHVTSMKEISLPPEAVISLSGMPGGLLELHTYDPKEKGRRRSGMPPLRTESQLGLRYCFEPTKASDTLSIKWLLPGVRHLFATKPLYYIASLLNNKGPGSLTALLRERELAHSVRAGVSEGGEDFTWFEIRVEMTIFSQKLQQMRRNQRERAADDAGSELPVDAQEDSVVKIVQQYIALVTAPKSGFEWRWAEMKTMADINFKFAEKTPAMDYASGLASNMHHYPPEKVMSEG